MDQSLIQRALNLVKKTGDKLVIVDPEKGDGLVILTLDEYEVMVTASKGVGVLSNSRVTEINTDEAALTASLKASMIASESEPDRGGPLQSAPVVEEKAFLNDGLELEERYYLEPLE